MGDFQAWLVSTLSSVPPVAAVMRTAWGWPIVESIHFIGLTLLFGTIAAWDLRLVGMARRVPMAAFHRLVPFAVLGFAINAASGSMFLMTEPNQYIYNPAFHFKLLFLALAGLNVLLFYSTIFRRVTALGPGDAPPHAARFFGAASLVLWTAVIICGRLLTFYRPLECFEGEAVGFFVYCLR
jgi:hypothetical protein